MNSIRISKFRDVYLTDAHRQSTISHEADFACLNLVVDIFLLEFLILSILDEELASKYLSIFRLSYCWIRQLDAEIPTIFDYMIICINMS